VLFMYLFGWIFDSDFLEWAGFQCPEASGGSTDCTGVSALIRMSFSLAIFHTLMFLSTLCRNKFSAALHEGFWTFKVLLIIGIWIGSLWIPNDPVMDGYLVMAKWVSVLFLIY